MQLTRVRLIHVGPHEALDWSLRWDDGPRARSVVLLGESGVGKTSLLAAVAATRPGLAIALLPTAVRRAEAEPVVPRASTEWTLAEEDPSRPHALVVASPNAVFDEPEDAVVSRRREQALFDRRAVSGGFAFCAISGARWFSRTPVVLSSPERSILRHDARATATFDDPTRADAARDVKQALVLLHLAAAQVREGSPRLGARHDYVALDRSLRASIAPALEGFDLRYVGISPATLEPEFEIDTGDTVVFDDLPRGAKHLLAIVTAPFRAFAAASPGRDPRDVDGVVLVDDVDLCLPRALQERVPDIAQRALPKAQWVLATSSPLVALRVPAESIFALRREKRSGRVELQTGRDAVLH